MTPQEKRALAEQIQANPLFDDLLTQIEENYTERMIAADTDTARLEAQSLVRAARSFREDFEALLRNDPPRRGAIA